MTKDVFLKKGFITHKELIDYILTNNDQYPYDRFYIKHNNGTTSIHDNYDQPTSCGLIIDENNNITVRSYSLLDETTISLENALIIGRNFFSSGADYAAQLVLEKQERKQIETSL